MIICRKYYLLVILNGDDVIMRIEKKVVNSLLSRHNKFKYFEFTFWLHHEKGKH